MSLSRIAQFERAYPGNARAVLSSIAKVRRAGRSDPAKLEAERQRHRAFMESLSQ